MYPVPPEVSSFGQSEEILGRWLKKNNKTKHPRLATKISGPAYVAPQSIHIRGGLANLDRENLYEAVEGSLSRLSIDRIDHYLIHWPSRKMPIFGRPSVVEPHFEEVPIEETLSALADLQAEGKIGSFGVSNETAWGVCKYNEISLLKGFPRISTIQNAYNLLLRDFEGALEEVCLREGVGLMAYSPLAFGALTGKYIGGVPFGSRLRLWPRFSRYNSERARLLTEIYVKLAQGHGLKPSQAAIAYLLSKKFVSTVILGVTNLNQLEEDIGSINIELDAEYLSSVERLNLDYPRVVT